MHKQTNKQTAYFALREPLSEEDDLCDHGRVWHDHGDGPEHALEVVRQLSTSGVARVHGDEYPARGVQPDLTALEDETGGLRGQGLQDREDLLRNH